MLPEHAGALGQIVSMSGYLESLLGHLLAYLTQTSAPVAMAMFHSVTSTDAQRAMLTAAAEQRLMGAELEEFRDLMAEFRTRYGERSRLVHNVWGDSPAHPDKAIWCAAKDTTIYSANLAAVRDTQELDLLQVSPTGELWRKCSTYTLRDLQDVFVRLQTYTFRVQAFVMKMHWEHPVIAATLAESQASAGQDESLQPPSPQGNLG